MTMPRNATCPYQIHAAQSVNEFIEMIRRHGCTPIRWMDEIGILDERSIIGHGIFLDHHPWLHWSTRDDLALLAERGVTVAHCPTVFMRRGIALNTFDISSMPPLSAAPMPSGATISAD